MVSHGENVWCLEVKRGRSGKRSGLEAFRRKYPSAQAWLIGKGGIDLEEFFSRPPQEWFAAPVSPG